MKRAEILEPPCELPVLTDDRNLAEVVPRHGSKRVSQRGCLGHGVLVPDERGSRHFAQATLLEDIAKHEVALGHDPDEHPFGIDDCDAW